MPKVYVSDSQHLLCYNKLNGYFSTESQEWTIHTCLKPNKKTREQSLRNIWGNCTTCLNTEISYYTKIFLIKKYTFMSEQTYKSFFKNIIILRILFEVIFI